MIAQVRAVPLLGGLEQSAVPAGDWEDLSACPICGGGVEDVGRVTAGDDIPGPVTAACLVCEHLFLQRRPTTTWFDGYYAQEWDRRGQAKMASGARMPKPASKVAQFCAPHLCEPARVLDMGAGFGSQLLGFRARGHEVAGVERSEHRAKFVREHLGIPCQTVPFEEAEFEGGFDLVFSHHVLEHVSDPKAVIAKQASLLRDGGLIYVAVPNLWHEHPPQTFHFVGHLSVFTLHSLSRLLGSEGLEVISSREDRELQVLARRGTAGQARPDAGFAERLHAWAHEAFGGEGHRVLIWQKARRPDAVFAARAVSPVWLALRRRLPVPRLDPSMRALDVEVRDGNDAPSVTVRHSCTEPPVWIK